jgi:hypothetical protein
LFSAWYSFLDRSADSFLPPTPNEQSAESHDQSGKASTGDWSRRRVDIERSRLTDAAVDKPGLTSGVRADDVEGEERLRAAAHASWHGQLGKAAQSEACSVVDRETNRSEDRVARSVGTRIVDSILEVAEASLMDVSGILREAA